MLPCHGWDLCMLVTLNAHLFQGKRRFFGSGSKVIPNQTCRGKKQKEPFQRTKHFRPHTMNPLENIYSRWAVSQYQSLKLFCASSNLPRLQICNVSAGEMDTYKCFAVNKYGRAFCSAKLTVAGGKLVRSLGSTLLFLLNYSFSPV